MENRSLLKGDGSGSFPCLDCKELIPNGEAYCKDCKIKIDKKYELKRVQDMKKLFHKYAHGNIMTVNDFINAMKNN